MASRRYRAIRKRDRKGGDVWGVAAFEPQSGKPWRQVAWKTVGRDAQGEIEARALAIEMERQEAEHGDRFLCWHVAGERLPLDRTVRDYVHHHADTRYEGLSAIAERDELFLRLRYTF